VKTKFLAMILAVLFCACSSEETDIHIDQQAKNSALNTILGGDIRAHIEILADDDMQGREAGTEGYQRAVNYVIDQYKAIGLTPISDSNTYLQPINFFETRLIPESAEMSLGKNDQSLKLVFRDDFIQSGSFGDAEEHINAPLIFVGYGIVAPEYGHDDYENLDVKGKILVMLSGAPPSFGTDQRAFYSSRSGKAAVAASREAAGIIRVRTPIDQKRFNWERYLPGIGSPGMRWIKQDGQPFEGHPELIGSALLSESGAKKLFDFSNINLEEIFVTREQGITGSFDMNINAKLARRSLQREISSSNVIGVFTGSDPDLRDEYVIYTAHLDHIGVRPTGSGDDIHNGAYDNAAGIGIILDIAQAVGSMPIKPRRSIIFAAVTAEEKGLQGSSYFAKNPPVAANNILANVNIDMPYLGFPVNDVIAFGAEHSSLYDAVLKATAELGMELTPDPLPHEVRFVRSDQFSFVKAGIPAIGFKAGSQSLDDNYDGDLMLDDFLKNHYHKASDDLSLSFSHEGAERFARAGFLTGLYIANDERRPQWNENDFFGEKFAP